MGVYDGCLDDNSGRGVFTLLYFEQCHQYNTSNYPESTGLQRSLDRRTNPNRQPGFSPQFEGKPLLSDRRFGCGVEDL